MSRKPDEACEGGGGAPDGPDELISSIGICKPVCVGISIEGPAAPPKLTSAFMLGVVASGISRRIEGIEGAPGGPALISCSTMPEVDSTGAPGILGGGGGTATDFAAAAPSFGKSPANTLSTAPGDTG